MGFLTCFLLFSPICLDFWVEQDPVLEVGRRVIAGIVTHVFHSASLYLFRVVSSVKVLASNSFGPIVTTLMAGSQVHPTESTLIWQTAAPAGSTLPPWKRLELHPVLQRLSFKRLVDLCPNQSRQLRQTMVYMKMCYCEQSDSK